jgi:hypothetical protein
VYPGFGVSGPVVICPNVRCAMLAIKPELPRGPEAAKTQRK